MLFKQPVKKNCQTILVIKKNQLSPKDNDAHNYRNGHNKKILKPKYDNIDVAILRDRQASFEP